MIVIILIIAIAVIWYLVSIRADNQWSQMTDEERRKQVELWYADDYCDRDD